MLIEKWNYKNGNFRVESIIIENLKIRYKGLIVDWG